MKSKWEEFNLYHPFTGDLTTWKGQGEELKVISFLAALGPQYESAKNQLLTGADLPTLNATFFRLPRMFVEENQSEEPDGGVAMTVATFPKPSYTRGGGRGRGSLRRKGGHVVGKIDTWQCDFFQKPGHTEDKCWSKHGKPKWATKNEPTPKSSSTASATTSALTVDLTTTPENVTLSHKDFNHLLNLAYGDTDIPSATLAHSGILPIPIHRRLNGLWTQVLQIIWLVLLISLLHMQPFTSNCLSALLMEVKSQPMEKEVSTLISIFTFMMCS